MNHPFVTRVVFVCVATGVALLTLALLEGGSAAPPVQFAPREGGGGSGWQPVHEDTTSKRIRNGEVSPPAFTKEVERKLAASEGFAALAMITDRGFEPKEVTIRSGEVVRITNNSSEPQRVSIAGLASGAVSIRGCDEGGASCVLLAPSDFIEVKAHRRGAWEVARESADGSATPLLLRVM